MNTQESRRGFLSEILIGWMNLVEIIVVAIFVAFGINLVASGLITHAQLSPSISIILGTTICLISVLYLIARILRRRSRFRTYEGFLIYNKELNKLIPVPRYSFSEHVSDYVDAGFYENKALEIIWNREPLRLPFDTEVKELKGKGKAAIQRRLRHPPRTYQLIREATEYFVLSRLSMHLADYFSDEKFREENLKVFQRDDVPDVLLKNRFLALFSKPMEERPPFVDETFRGKGEENQTVAAYFGKAIYEKFDLVLPKGSVVHRTGKNRVNIETKRFTINLTVRFDGVNTYIPSDFLRHYLSISKSRKEIEEYLVRVDLLVYFKFGALFSRTGWEYYRWIDSFLEVLDRDFSESTFFKSIGWNTAITVIKCVTRKSNSKRKKTINSSRANVKKYT